jgi:hypothetical protein
MGILDEAIREHLELKRQHGAEESELQQLEDEAFGQAERPGDEPSDAMAEAPTEFMAQPDAAEAPTGRREPTIADLQEPPPPPAPEPAPEEPPADEPPAEEEQPAMEHEIVADVPEPAEAEAEVEEPEPAGPTTEERRAIAEQPTELFEIEEEEAEVTVQGPAPDDDEEYEDEDDAFWNEQRLSDELDQALEGPSDSAPIVVEEPDSGEEVLPVPEDHEPAPEEEPESDDEPKAEGPSRYDDVLDETPDFLEEAPEDDQLWFEQKPPKDFDFD